MNNYEKSLDLLERLSNFYRLGYPNNKQRVKDLLGEVDDFFKEIDGEE